MEGNYVVVVLFTLVLLSLLPVRNNNKDIKIIMLELLPSSSMFLKELLAFFFLYCALCVRNQYSLLLFQKVLALRVSDCFNENTQNDRRNK
ncbi:hypothetical protein BS640_18910 [Rouxiella badensis]|uniref:Uncharacterized protein n=1 Tax=Rouxiella badensis TaxID=1646377 RepID=A0A1X0WB77_9GAMM|nr:hypothetical protein BS640_18910 [Rouxiella badensis]